MTATDVNPDTNDVIVHQHVGFVEFTAYMNGYKFLALLKPTLIILALGNLVLADASEPVGTACFFFTVEFDASMPMSEPMPVSLPESRAAGRRRLLHIGDAA